MGAFKLPLVFSRSPRTLFTAMHLQSIEIFGFKSFAAKTVLNFDKGVTAIVGPNGCGKSNVLDAIRWVLGEQSAKALRGGEMADVIFSGTDSRPALGMAEVSMTFADCEKELGTEWREVCITRRVFRDGNSEYLLNKTTCRLRDIQQLFMDTGIGRSAYSIMEQGKIDAILSSRPEDRRAIFEEAAGITKYKSQKREALRKLEATEANLLRVSDIIKEVKRQIGSLQRQAAKARRYQALIADLRTLETHFARHQWSELDAQMEKARGEIARLGEAQGTKEGEIEAGEGGIAAQRAQLEGLDAALTAARQSVQDLKNQLSNAEHRVRFNGERVKEFAGLNERYERDIAAAEEKLRVQQTQLENTELELEQISGALGFEQARVAEKGAAVDALRARRMEMENAAGRVAGEIAKTEAKLNSLRAQTSSFIGQRDGSDSRLGILGSEIEGLAATVERLAAQGAELSAQLAGASAKLDAAHASAHETEAETRAVSTELDGLDRELREGTRMLGEKESKHEVLRQLNESGAGFAEGTQAVLRGLDNADFFKPFVAGALAAHMEVEPDFVTAIEAALGQNLQAVVMKDTMVAEAAVKTLAAKRLGRATLALRETGDRNRETGKDEPPAGGIAWALEKVKMSEDVAPLLRALLDGVLIVADVETALRLAAELFPVAGLHSPLSLVTLTGEVLTREGMLTGGSGKNDNGASVLQRKNEMTRIEAEAAELRARIAETTARREQATARLDAAKGRLAEARAETQTLTLSVTTLRGNLAALEREKSETEKRAANLRWERENIEKRHREAVDKLSAFETESHEAAARLAELHAEQNERASALDSLRKDESLLGAELNELRIRVATETQRHDSLRNQRAPMTARLNELRELIEQRRRDIEGYSAKSAELSGETARISAEMEATRREAAEGEEKVGALAAERARIAGGIESLESTLRILRRQLSDCQEQRGKEEVRQTQIQLCIDNLAEHIQRRYQVDVREFQPDSYLLLTTLRDVGKRQRKRDDDAAEAGAEAAPEPAEKALPDEDGQRIDWQRVEALVRELDGRMDSMGPINIDAIQEYDELEQRHTFLLAQFDDLAKSKAELLDVIAKINTTTRKLFAETFEQIRVNFQEMFVELFGGGKANLVLTDESDPLESGIDIIAKPPGKQLQSITLLSGGEKTMTAVSLLFSIYMVKPSPFCVLDEMDAPLDESNIMRFVKILDRFVGQSQFVVITHNKRTIARADVLYGVTMEEHGVSKLVGVKFARREESVESADIIGTSNAVVVPSVAESFGKTAQLHSERAAAV